MIAGVNMEGPFIDPIKKGAQAEENIVAPNAEFFRACNAASGGKIRLVTLAPNMPGSLEFIKEVSDEVMVSIGHTTADYDTALAAMKAGAHHVTHLTTPCRRSHTVTLVSSAPHSTIRSAAWS